MNESHHADQHAVPLPHVYEPIQNGLAGRQGMSEAILQHGPLLRRRPSKLGTSSHSPSLPPAHHPHPHRAVHGLNGLEVVHTSVPHPGPGHSLAVADLHVGPAEGSVQVSRVLGKLLALLLAGGVELPLLGDHAEEDLDVVGGLVQARGPRLEAADALVVDQAEEGQGAGAAEEIGVAAVELADFGEVVGLLAGYEGDGIEGGDLHPEHAEDGARVLT